MSEIVGELRGVPIVEGRRVKRPMTEDLIVIDECPFCGSEHTHGGNLVGGRIDHRGAHCATDDRPGDGYFIIEEPFTTEKPRP